MSTGPRDAKSTSARALAVVAAIVLFVALVLAVLFFLANDEWVVILIPSAPWSTEPAAGAFEAHIAAMLAVPFAVGLGMGLLLRGRRMRKLQRQLDDSKAQIGSLENEVENVSRLLSASSERS